MNFSDIVQGEDGFLVELRCNNTFQVQLFGKIKAYLLENQPAWKAAGAIPIPDAVAMFNLIDQLAGGNRYWSEETGRQAEDALFELQEIIDSLPADPTGAGWARNFAAPQAGQQTGKGISLKHLPPEPVAMPPRSW